MIPWDRTKGRPEPISALNRIRELENGEPLVDLREFAPSVIIYRPQTIPYCRLTVAKMVEQAANNLPEGYRLGVTDAWRPIERQQRIYDRMYAFAKATFPERDHTALRRTVCQWVAPTDQKAPPGHCTGAALDVYLLNSRGKRLDVSSPYDRFKAARTYTIGLTPRAYRQRMLLVETMLGVGFSNCRDEWWHYSFGDAGWAVRLGLDTCIYGLARLDPSLYEEQERIAMRAIRRRKNPFARS